MHSISRHFYPKRFTNEGVFNSLSIDFLLIDRFFNTDDQKSGYKRLRILINPYFYITPHAIPLFRI